MLRFLRPVLLSVLAIPWAARGQIDDIRRQEVDAGVRPQVVTKVPAVLTSVDPVYPPEAEKEGLTGDVKMRITVGADGSVTDPEVTEPIGHGFDEAALAAVRQYKFSPGEVDGVPFPLRIEYGITFTLKPKPVEAKPEAPLLPATLKGQVVARGSRKRVSGATLRCGDAADAPEAVTDEEGRFTLSVPPGDCKLRVVATDYERSETLQSLKPGETAELDVYLLPKAVGYETVVHGKRDKVEVVSRTLDREELEAVPGSLGDPIRVIQDLPGVARAPFVLGQLIVRGASPAETDTQLDGVSIPILYHLGAGPSVINPQFLDHIDFYPGGFGARYGRAVGGIVDVYTRRGAADTAHGEAKVDLLDADFFLEAPITSGVSVAAAGRRSYIDALLPLVLPNGLLAIPYYWDYQVRMDVGPPKGQPLGNGQSSFYVMAFGSNDILKLVSTGSGISAGRNISLNVHTLFHDVKGDWTYRLGDFTSVFTPYVGYTLVAFGFGNTTLSADDYTIGAREDVKWEPSRYFTVRAGFDIVGDHLAGKATLPVFADTQYPGFRGADQQTGTQEIGMTLNSSNPGFYAETDLKLGPLTVTPGLRFNYDRELGHEMTSWDPRLWARLQLTDRTQLKGSVGLYSQPPDTQDLVAPPFGNPNLKEQRAFQSSVGVAHKFTDAINADLTGFYNRRYDIVANNPFTVTNPDGSQTLYQYSNDGLGRAYGLELLIRHEVTKHFFGWIAYTLSRSEVRNKGGGDYVLSSFDQTHILTVIASYRLPYGFELGGRFRYVTGDPYTPMIHPYDQLTVDDLSFHATYGDPRSARRPDFNQLDLRIDKFFVFQHWTLDAYLDVQNVYNQRNIETAFSDYRFRYSYDVPGIPFLPVLGLKGSF